MHKHKNLPLQVFLPAIYDIEESGAIFPENMPNTKFIRNCFMLPNLLNELTNCCFSTVNLSASTRSNNPMIHVLSKAWPVRCSIRNFSDIVSNYISKEAHVRECLTEMLYCTFSGQYPHCETLCDEKLKFDCEHIIYRYFVHMKPDAKVLSNWIRDDHQHIVFVCIKEYIVFLVNNVPGLCEILHEIHPWKDFVSSVMEQANFVRKKMRDNVKHKKPIFDNIQTGVTAMRSFRCKLSASSMSKKKCLVEKDIPFHPQHLHVFNVPLRVKFYTLLRKLNINNYNAAENFFKLKTLTNSFDLRFAQRELMCAVNFAIGQSFVTLPHHIVCQQRAAMAKCNRHTSVFVCICCKQIRSFVVNVNTASKNAWARGNSKVLIDDCTNDLYCGKKIEKTNTVATHDSDSVSKKNRMYWKTETNLMCKFSKLVEVNLVGKIYNLFSTSYVLCPSCLCVMEYTTDRVRCDTILCIQCQYASCSAYANGNCFHCYGKCSESSNLGLFVENKFQRVCNCCYKPWMEKTDLTKLMSVEMVHRAINERWKANRIYGEVHSKT